MMRKIKIRIVFIVILVFLTLFAPFELSRIIIMTQNGQKFWATPWYWVAELIAIWVGYVIALPFMWKAVYEIHNTFIQKEKNS